MRSAFARGTILWVFLASPFALALASLGVACGGGAPPNAPTSAPPTPGAAGATGGGEPGHTPTTTGEAVLLGDGGDLKGTVLTSATATPTSTGGNKGADGGHSGGHSSEPGRSANDIRVIIMARRDDIRACYDKALKGHPGLEGDLDIKWTIDPKGNVTDVTSDEVKSTIHNRDVVLCIGDVIRKIKFNESAKGLESHAHYPFNFNPKSGGRTGGPDAGTK